MNDEDKSATPPTSPPAYTSLPDAIAEALPAKPIIRARVDPASVVAHHRRKLAALRADSRSKDAEEAGDDE